MDLLKSDFSTFEGCAFLQSAHTEFSRESGSSASGRERMMCQIAAAYDAFRDLQNNLKEGTKFYNDLTQVFDTIYQSSVMVATVWSFSY